MSGEENLLSFQDDKINRKLITVAKDLRKNEVSARKKLWSALAATLMIALNGGYICLLLDLVPDSYSYITSSVDFLFYTLGWYCKPDSNSHILRFIWGYLT